MDKATKIIYCVCKSAFQDKLYGKNKRVANQCNPDTLYGGNKYRCTVCGKEKF